MESSKNISKEKEENNQIKSNNQLENIKNKYILQKVFDNLKEKDIKYGKI